MATRKKRANPRSACVLGTRKMRSMGKTGKRCTCKTKAGGVKTVPTADCVLVTEAKEDCKPGSIKLTFNRREYGDGIACVCKSRLYKRFGQEKLLSGSKCEHLLYNKQVGDPSKF